MPVMSECPVPVKRLNDPPGSGGGVSVAGSLAPPGGVVWSTPLAFHVGVGAGGAPADLWAFLSWAFESTETFTFGGASVERIVPLRHPFLPNLVAVGVRWRCTGRPIEEDPGWTDAKIEIEFGVPAYNLDTFYTVRTRFGGEFDTIPNAAMAFADGTRITGDWGVFVPEIAMVVTTFQSPAPVGPAIGNLVGKVSSATFLGWSAGYVRFDGVESDFAQTMAMTTTYVKSFAITFRSRPWNEVMKPSGASEVPLNVSTGLPKYQSGDLNALLY
jgi:hypothetical protein